MAEQITPTCKYGHGNLERQGIAGVDDNQQFSVNTFPQKRTAENMGGFYIYSFTIYKCHKCSYMELHDIV